MRKHKKREIKGKENAFKKAKQTNKNIKKQKKLRFIEIYRIRTRCPIK